MLTIARTGLALVRVPREIIGKPNSAIGTYNMHTRVLQALEIDPTIP